MRSFAAYIIVFLFFASGTVSAQTQDSTFLAMIDSLKESINPPTADTSVVVDMAGLDSAFIQQLRLREAVRGLMAEYSALALKEEKKMSHDGAMQILVGSAIMLTERKITDLPGFYKSYPSHTGLYDYVPAFAPLAATWIMKAAGVQSRSKIKRMIVANVMAYALTAGVSQGFKYTVNRTRPNGDSRSFPSGHAAFAYASATILDREYGHVSPWISVGGYVCATGTQVLRIKHNAHWMSDLTVGAGIGTLCTNLAYFITDRIFGDKQINTPEMRRRDLMNAIRFMQRPSGFHFFTGTEFGDRKVAFSDEGYDITLSSALFAGVEYNHFFNESWAIDAKLRGGVSYARYSPGEADAELPKFQEGGQMEMVHADMGARYSRVVLPTLRLGIHALAGMRYTSACLDISHHINPEVGVGINGDMLTGKKYYFGLEFDYTHAFSPILRNRFFVGSSLKILM